MASRNSGSTSSSTRPLPRPSAPTTRCTPSPRRTGTRSSSAAAGDVTEPEGPDAFFGQTFEQWRVVEGTGVFEGARGEGTITTAVDVAGRGPAEAPTGSNVVKHIQGTLQLSDCFRPTRDR